jgi:hypothetical protein
MWTLRNPHGAARRRRPSPRSRGRRTWCIWIDTGRWHATRILRCNRRSSPHCWPRTGRACSAPLPGVPPPAATSTLPSESEREHCPPTTRTDRTTRGRGACRPDEIAQCKAVAAAEKFKYDKDLHQWRITPAQPEGTPAPPLDPAEKTKVTVRSPPPPSRRVLAGVGARCTC